MRKTCADHPAWASIVLGGTIADLVQSLPADDPWRSCSARIGRLVMGQHPPNQDGARLPDGGRLGSWTSFVDTLGRPAEGANIELDPAYTPVLVDLSGVSEAVLAFGAQGWEKASAAVSATLARASSTSAVDDLPHLPGVLTLNPAPVYTYAAPALRWAAYRRRSYGTSPDDPWLAESLYRWSWRAGRVLGGMDWDLHMVEVRITAETLAPIPNDPF